MKPLSEILDTIEIGDAVRVTTAHGHSYYGTVYRIHPRTMSVIEYDYGMTRKHTVYPAELVEVVS